MSCCPVRWGAWQARDATPRSLPLLSPPLPCTPRACGCVHDAGENGRAVSHGGLSLRGCPPTVLPGRGPPPPPGATSMQDTCMPFKACSTQCCCCFLSLSLSPSLPLSLSLSLSHSLFLSLCLCRALTSLVLLLRLNLTMHIATYFSFFYYYY